METFPFYEVSGSPYEIGFQEGSHFRAQVGESIRCYREMFMDYAQLSWERAKALSRRFIPVIEAYQPDYLAEMQGLTDGAQFSFEDILALNCRSELVFAGKELAAESGGCTSIGVSAERGRGGDAYLAHNWDWKTSQRRAMIMVKLRQTQGRPDVFLVTEAGIIGKTGFNSAGLGLYLNALATNQAPQGLPLHMAMRAILDCRTLAEAIRAATLMPLGCCANFMLGHRNGECVDLEIENEDFDVLYPREGLIVHTNHFLSPRLPLPPRKDTQAAGQLRAPGPGRKAAPLLSRPHRQSGDRGSPEGSRRAPLQYLPPRRPAAGAGPAHGHRIFHDHQPDTGGYLVL